MPPVNPRLAAALAGRYRLDRELGAGGMATVHLAYDEKHEREVAIKVLHPELAAALGGERFLTEIKTTARLQHPHILPLLDSGEADGLLYYVMPYVTGETLRARLERERQLPIDDALRIAREIADALGAAHAMGIIHRDIKPENILLQGGHALVADFGIALAVQSAGGARMTQTGLSLGTPQYMSPEQAMGEKTIDLRADLYALGAVTYEMLSGEPPFTGASVQAIVSRVMTEDPRPLVAQRRAIPEAVEGAVLRALEKLPADRFGSAAEFVAALEHGVTRRAPTTKRQTSATNTARLIGMVAAVAVIAIIGGWQLGRRTSTATIPSQALSIALPDSARVAFHGNPEMPGGLGSVAISRDSSRLVWVGTAAQGVRLFTRDLGSFAIHPIPGTDGAYAPFISADGARVGYFVGNELRVVTLATGESRVLSRELKEVAGASFFEDGRVLVARAFSGALVISPTGSSQALGSQDNFLLKFSLTMPSLIPGDQQVVGVLRSDVLTVMNTRDGSVRSIGRRYAGAAPADSVLTGRGPRVQRNVLFWTEGDVLFGAPFDAKAAAITAPPVQLATGVRGDVTRAADFDVNSAGTLVFVAGGDPDVGPLAWISPSGAVDTLPLPMLNYIGWNISRDGRRLVTRSMRRATAGGGSVVEARDHGVFDFTTGRLTPLDLPRGRTSQVSWAADNESVIFSLQARNDSVPNIVRVPTDGRRTVDTLVRGQALRRYAVSRDGHTTVLGLAAEADTKFLISRDGGPFVDVKADKLPQTPTLSPDGKWVAYERFDSRVEVYVSPLPWDGRAFPVSEGGGYEPIFSAKGDRIFYRQGRGIMVASFTPGPTPQIGRSTQYVQFDFADFTGRAWDLGPDNRVLAKLLPSTTPQREIRVMNGVFDLVRAAGRGGGQR